MGSESRYRDRRLQNCYHSVQSHLYTLSYLRSAGYTHKRLTENLKVPYYVGDQFPKEFSGANLKNLERTVEDEFIGNLRNNCWKEKQQSMPCHAPPHTHLHQTANLLILESISHQGISNIYFHELFLLQKKVCYTERAILVTLSFTKERRGLEPQAVPSCLRSQPPCTDGKFYTTQLHTAKTHPLQRSHYIFTPWHFSLKQLNNLLNGGRKNGKNSHFKKTILVN